jgi:hypothetical protein
VTQKNPATELAKISNPTSIEILRLLHRHELLLWMEPPIWKLIYMKSLKFKGVLGKLTPKHLAW